MEYKKTIILLALVVFLLSIAGVSASEIDNTIASENANTIELSADNDIEDNLQTSEENDELASTDYDETIAQTDTEVWGADLAKYSDLAEEISHSGDITLTHKSYTYDEGAPAITISEANKVIDGNGAVIDMAGSTIRAFYISASGVTIKNLTIKNANHNGDGGAIYFTSSATSGTVTNCNFTNNKATGDASYGGAVYFYNQGTVTNCNFTNNSAVYGGAVYFLDTGEVTNCNFTNNSAVYGGAILMTSGSVENCNFTNNHAGYGGAVYFSSGTVTNCNFVDNKATGNYGCGGAVYFSSGTVTNCNFVDNKATGNYGCGGAVYLDSNGEVTNCNFADNSAINGKDIYSVLWSTADTCIFKSSDTTFNIGIFPPTLNVDNFTTFYGSGEKLTFDLKTNSGIPVTNGNISISVYFKDNNSWVGNYSCLSGEGWIPDLRVGSYYAIFDTEYARFQAINRTITVIIPAGKYYVNVTSLATNNKTVNITAKTNIPQNITWDGKLLFILPNGTQINANYGTNGTWWAVHTFDECREYNVAASYVGLDNVTLSNATITVNKLKTVLTASSITAGYNANNNLIVTLKDIYSNPLVGQTLTVSLNGVKTYITDKNGQIKVPIKGLVPKAYSAKITFKENVYYLESSIDVKVTVKKAKSKLTAKKMTFKKSKKVKKYSVTLKDANKKPIKNAKLTIKIKKKTFKAKTNKKGKATFKIKKLTKKGTYKAKITYKGNNCYFKVIKTVKIKLR